MIDVLFRLYKSLANYSDGNRPVWSVLSSDMLTWTKAIYYLCLSGR